MGMTRYVIYLPPQNLEGRIAELEKTIRKRCNRLAGIGFLMALMTLLLQCHIELLKEESRKNE